MNRRVGTQLLQFLGAFGIWLYSTAAVALDGFPALLVAAALAWPVSFRIHKTTRVLRDPENVVGGSDRLTYRQYHEAMLGRAHSQRSEAYYSSGDKHWTEKAGTLMADSEAMAYAYADSRSILILILVSLPTAAAVFLPEGRQVLQSVGEQARLPLSLLFGATTGFVSGARCGEFYRWVRGHVAAD